jgi:peptidyl-tRNA hydrolase
MTSDAGAKDHAIQKWMNGGMTKICVRVGSEAELLEMAQKAKGVRLPTDLRLG